MFEPESGPRKDRRWKTVNIAFDSEKPTDMEIKARIENAAAKHNLRVAAFCKQAILYALDNMED